MTICCTRASKSISNSTTTRLVGGRVDISCVWNDESISTSARFHVTAMNARRGGRIDVVVVLPEGLERLSRKALSGLAWDDAFDGGVVSHGGEERTQMRRSALYVM
jgi:hypothetical protein